MAAEANEASTVTPRSEAEGPPSKEALSPTPPGLTDLPQKVTQPDLPPPNWHREKPRKSSRVLKELGVSVHFLQCGAGVGGREWSRGGTWSRGGGGNAGRPEDGGGLRPYLTLILRFKNPWRDGTGSLHPHDTGSMWLIEASVEEASSPSPLFSIPPAPRDTAMATGGRTGT